MNDFGTTDHRLSEAGHKRWQRGDEPPNAQDALHRMKRRERDDRADALTTQHQLLREEFREPRVLTTYEMLFRMRLNLSVWKNEMRVKNPGSQRTTPHPMTWPGEVVRHEDDED